MKPEEAEALATTLTGAFSAQKETTTSFAWAIKDFDFAPMQRAVKKAMVERERMPSLKALLGSYYAERRNDRAATIVTGSIPCEVCQRIGAVPAKAAVQPFVHSFTAAGEDREGRITEQVVWPHESCCPTHARHVTWAARATQEPTTEFCLRYPGARFGKPWLDANKPPTDMDAAWRDEVIATATAIEALPRLPIPAKARRARAHPSSRNESRHP